MTDTPPAVDEIYHRMVMQKSPAERCSMAARMCTSGRMITMAGVKKDFPELSGVDLKRQFFLRMYGADLSPSVRDGFCRNLDRGSK